MLIREARERDVPAIGAIINAAAQAYRGVIPADRWHEPYMPMDELVREIADGVRFWVAVDDDADDGVEHAGRVEGAEPIGRVDPIGAVMGLQDKGPVSLVRHAYTDPARQGRGLGTQLLRHIEQITDKPLLIGTWAAAEWAIRFYQRNGFMLVSVAEKELLLRTFWSIPERQVSTSVVLADRRWLQSRGQLIAAGDLLRLAVEKASPALLAMSDEQSLHPRKPGAWTPRQIVGHLIDSACNNHGRFVRAQSSDDLVCTGYDQEAWVAAQRYDEAAWSDLVSLWRAYNLHLARIIAVIPSDALTRPRAQHNLDQVGWRAVPRTQPATLDGFIRDYIGHLENHLSQILESHAS